MKAEMLQNKMQFSDLQNMENCSSYGKSKVAPRLSDRHEKPHFGDFERLFRFVPDVKETWTGYRLKVQSPLNIMYASDETDMQIRQRFSQLKVLIRPFSTVAEPYFQHEFCQMKIYFKI